MPKKFFILTHREFFMKLSSIVAAAALACVSLTSTAATLQAGEVSFGSKTLVNQGAFVDTYFFELDFPPPGNVAFSFAELQFTSPFLSTDITDLKVSFFANMDLGTMTGSAPLWGTPYTGTSLPGGATAVSLDTVTLNQKTFWMQVSGNAVGSLNNAGAYNFAIMANPVPEPESLTLALGGLGLVGTALYKRRRAAANA
ncbi:hypothetical protein DEH84_16650 [Aquabacterium olei]|uniref:Ice-binding protein C-terminal domain-containing protein n=1 Tax=Aquabacterium olei TaxID=1296669 RepID=A0A2U8FX96_9BURK|nr:FxDxF family PEP-CTERM protein [Aquabacterium olei]AWI54866.1 hypothetical protein DEH84_16650 [Aquabacterium olei]